MPQKTSIACKEYRTLSPDLYVKHHIVVHLSHYSNLCIGYQSSNVLSKNSPQWRTSLTTPAATLPSPAHWSASTRSLSAFIKFCSTHCSIHENSNRSTSFLQSAPIVWNSLPSAVRETSSQPQFLRRLKGYLFQRVFGWRWLPSASASLP